MNLRYIVFVSFIVALGGFLMGFDASVISGVVKFIEPQFDLSKIQLGWAVSCLTLTATLAMFMAGPLSDKLGRRTVLKYAAALYFISAIGSAIAPSFWFLVLARMLDVRFRSLTCHYLFLFSIFRSSQPKMVSHEWIG